MADFNVSFFILFGFLDYGCKDTVFADKAGKSAKNRTFFHLVFCINVLTI